MNFFKRITFAKEEILLKEIGRFAEQYGTKIYVVGGYVRDIILERPSKDIDLVIVEGDGVIFAKALQRHFQKKGVEVTKVATFPHYGTSQFLVEGIEVEIVRARKESYTPTTFKPEVIQGSLEDDIYRRDFTINTLAYLLNPRDEPKGIVDLTRMGEKDLMRGIIRTPLDPLDTFYDDPTRIFRAIRFASKYNFRIESQTQKALQQFFYDSKVEPPLRDRVQKFRLVPIEHINTELTKVIAQENPRKYLKLMKDLDILRFVLPGLDLLFYIEQNPRYHKHNVGRHTLNVLGNLKTSSLITRLAAIMHDYGKMTHTTIDEEGEIHTYRHEISKLPEIALKRLKYPNKVIANVTHIIKMHMCLYPPLKQAGIRRVIRDAGGVLDELLDLILADSTASAVSDKDKMRVKALIDYIQDYDESEKNKVQNLKSPLDGHEIIELLEYPKHGTTPNWNRKYGTRIGQILKLIVEAILSEEIENTKEAAREFILGLPKDFLYPKKK
jgi:tRNA nucleotidyltransferase/poly(A) polymerase